MNYLYIIKSKLIRISFILLSMLLALNILQGQEPVHLRLLSPQQMKADVLFFYQKIEEIHPNPYFYIDTGEYENRKQKLLNDLNKPMNEIEFWMKIAQLNSIYDAHTGIRYPNNLISFLAEKKSLFFFNGMLKKNNQNTYWNCLQGIPDSLKNKEILKINNVPMDTIVNNISNYVSHEGNISTTKYIDDLFCIYYSLLYNLPQKIQVEYKEDSVVSNTKSISLTMADFEQWDSINRSNDADSELPYLFRFYNTDSIAVFELNSFSVGEDAKSQFDSYDKALSQAIDSLNKNNIKYLFIDITRNGGGSDVFANILLDYLNIPEKTYLGETTYKVSDAIRERSELNTWKSYFKLFYSKFARDMLLTQKGKTFTDKYYYKKNKKSVEYKGNVYLIQSNSTFSAPIRLSSFFKCYKLGTIIGEETGGLTACYIHSYSYELPNSKLKMYCSMQATMEPCGEWNGRGVLPDIEYKIEDPTKNFTLEQLKEMLKLAEKYKAKNKL